jgi:hypothetical protein
MLILRFLVLVLAVVAVAVVAAVTNVWWLGVIAVVVLVVLTAACVLLLVHYLGAPEWLGGSEEAQLETAGLVERESGLPIRRRWNERQARAYAEEVARRGLVAVPDGWQGPEGTHRVLLIATSPISPALLREHLPTTVTKAGLAVLVVVPTLAATAEAFHRGDPAEAVEHAEDVARRQLDLLRQADIACSGHIGPADPAVAVSDGLRTYAAEHVVVARHRGAGRYLEDVDVTQAAEIFDAPLTEIDIPAQASRT